MSLDSKLKISEDKLLLTEDIRLLIISFCIIKSGNIAQIFRTFKIAENFIDFEVYEDAAAMSTIDTAFQIIVLEYSKLIYQSRHSSRHDDQKVPFQRQSKDTSSQLSKMNSETAEAGGQVP